MDEWVESLLLYAGEVTVVGLDREPKTPHKSRVESVNLGGSSGQSLGAETEAIETGLYEDEGEGGGSWGTPCWAAVPYASSRSPVTAVCSAKASKRTGSKSDISAAHALARTLNRPASVDLGGGRIRLVVAGRDRHCHSDYQEAEGALCRPLNQPRSA